MSMIFWAVKDEKGWHRSDRRIDETLNHKEKCILFIGAYHDIKKKLPKDIHVMEVKDTEKVKEYQRLLPFYNKNRERFKELGGYLTSQVER